MFKGGAIWDGFVNGKELSRGDNNVTKEQMTNNIIKEIIEEIIPSKEGLGEVGKETTGELPELVLLDKPETRREVVDELFQSHDGSNIIVSIFSFHK